MNKNKWAWFSSQQPDYPLDTFTEHLTDKEKKYLFI
jgi:hypothetical protein